MAGVMVMQGRELRAADIDLIQGLLAEHPDWGRTRLSEALCRRWERLEKVLQIFECLLAVKRPLALDLLGGGLSSDDTGA